MSNRTSLQSMDFPQYPAAEAQWLWQAGNTCQTQHIPLSNKTPPMLLLYLVFFSIFYLLSLHRCSSRKIIDYELLRYKYSKPDRLTQT